MQILINGTDKLSFFKYTKTLISTDCSYMVAIFFGGPSLMVYYMHIIHKSEYYNYERIIGG